MPVWFHPVYVLWSLAALAVLFMILGAVRLFFAARRLASHDITASLAPLEAKIDATNAAIERANESVATLDSLTARAQAAADRIVASRRGIEELKAAAAQAVRDVRAEWRRLIAALR